MSDIIFLSWDGRPAIVDSSGESALAILSPGTDWVAVSGPDVFRSGEVIMDEESFRLKFADRFGSFNIPKHIPIKKLSYDYEKADQEVMEYLETPRGKAHKDRLLAMLEKKQEHDTSKPNDLIGDTIFTNWDGRPAIVDSLGLKALAILEPGGDWVPVDAGDVFTSARVISGGEASFKAIFSTRFGSFSIPKKLTIENLSYDFDAAEEKVEKYLEIPEGKARTERLVDAMKNSQTEEGDIEKYSEDWLEISDKEREKLRDAEQTLAGKGYFWFCTIMSCVVFSILILLFRHILVIYHAKPNIYLILFIFYLITVLSWMSYGLLYKIKYHIYSLKTFFPFVLFYSLFISMFVWTVVGDIFMEATYGMRLIYP
ncbi:MAG: hypothetical protein CMN43_01110 [SAR116 cluster bacterium]|nr:hypothetical protein [SAR116 cluster bacterium]